MEEGEWTATGLFSPSRARQVQAQARDWEYVDAWLTKKYSSGRAPPFERNEEILSALLALIAANNDADEQRNAIDRVEKTALQYLLKQNTDSGELLHKNISKYLDGTANRDLNNLAKSTIALDSSGGEITNLLTAAAKLQVEVFEARQAESRARGEIALLNAEHKRLSEILSELRGEHLKPSSEDANQTSEWIKGSKLLKAKMAEYEERSTAAKPSKDLVQLIEESVRTQHQVSAQRHRLEELELEIEACQALPASEEDARFFIDQARQELVTHQAKRGIS